MTLYTSKVVAEWLGLTERRVRQLRDDGILQPRQGALYDMKDCVRRYIKYLGGEARDDLNNERTMLTRAKREAAERENQIRAGQLHKSEDIELGLKTIFLNIKSRMLVLPAKLSPTLAHMGGDQGGIFDILSDAIEEALHDVTDGNAMMTVMENGAEANAGAGEDD